MTQHTILRVISKALIPLIVLFGLYVQFHGDYGPGGGFQAGVIVAAAFVLYTLIFGVKRAEQVSPRWLVETLMASGVLIYAGVGVATLVLGGNFLDYNQFAEDPHHGAHGQHLGIFLVEAGVGITVASVMMAIFYAFAGRRQPEDG